MWYGPAVLEERRREEREHAVRMMMKDLLRLVAMKLEKRISALLQMGLALMSPWHLSMVFSFSLSLVYTLVPPVSLALTAHPPT